ncbi:Uncharacterised protein [Brucella abortus]|nr:Uncharacterised protein [Brucella abortus]
MKTAFEFLVCGNQRRFGIDFKMTAKIDHGEEKVAIFFLDFGLVACGHGFFQFRCFLGNLVEDGGCLRPVKADLCRFLL